jgi:hypothetical protein
MSKRCMVALMIVTLICMSGQSLAGVCIGIDTRTDELTAEERITALELLKIAFENVGETVTETNCAKRYTLNNTRSDKSIRVRLSGLKESRALTITKIDELGWALDTMVRGLVTETSINDQGATVVDQTAFVGAEYSNTAQLRLGIVISYLGYFQYVESLPTPMGLEIGYQREWDGIALDLSISGSGSSNAQDEIRVQVGFLTLGVIYYLESLADHSLFVGASLADTVIAGYDDNGEHKYDYEGFSGRLSFGKVYFRSGRGRVILKLDLALPFDKLTPMDGVCNKTRRCGYYENKLYTPILGFSVGGSWVL